MRRKSQQEFIDFMLHHQNAILKVPARFKTFGFYIDGIIGPTSFLFETPEKYHTPITLIICVKENEWEITTFKCDMLTPELEKIWQEQMA